MEMRIGIGFGLLAAALVAGAAAPAAAGGFTLTSHDVPAGGTVAEAQVADTFGCSGGNLSPDLAWSGAPEGTKSFVLTVYDPDAPTGSGWWHWVVFDIPADAHGLAEGAGSGKAELPAGTRQGRTDFGAPGYGGPCPPPGDTHRYVFTLWALKIDHLGVPEDASAAMVGFVTRANALGHATFTATYGRPAAPKAPQE
jgi:Raf kinase inhibitor-like YbhB/YbcL family protein